jgi:hypothetical protein
LVALLERAERIDRVRAEVRRFADVRLDKTTEVGQRTVPIPISAIWFPATTLDPMKESEWPDQQLSKTYLQGTPMVRQAA